MIKCLLCKNGEIEEKEIMNDLQTYYSLINCHTIDFLGIPITEDNHYSINAIVDDEGKLVSKEISPILYPYLKKKYGYGIAGDFILVKVDNITGETISMTDGDIKMATTFIKVQELKYGETHEKYDAQRELERNEY